MFGTKNPNKSNLMNIDDYNDSIQFWGLKIQKLILNPIWMIVMGIPKLAGFFMEIQPFHVAKTMPFLRTIPQSSPCL